MSYLDTFTNPRILQNLVFIQSGGNMTLTPANPSAARTINLADPGGTDTIAYLAASQTLSNKTLGSNLAAGGYMVTGLGTTTNSTDAATKSYVDNAVLGVGTVLQSAICATTAALASNTYVGSPTFTLTATANGALTIDGISVTAGQRVLVKNEATASHNGVYVVTNAGSGSAAYVLTRAADMQTSAQIDNGAYIFITEGTTNATTAWVLDGGSLTLDTSSLSFVQFGGGSTYSQGNGISISSNVISAVAANSTITISGSGIAVSATYPGNTSLTTLGTVSTGTWQGTAVGVSYGGTGATSASGALTNLGAAPNSAGYYLNATNSSLSSGVVLSPSTGILLSSGSLSVDNTVVCTLTNTQTLTNKTLTSPVLNQPQLYETIVTESANFTASVTQDQYQVTTGSSSIVATVPQATSTNKGKMWTFTKVDSGSGQIQITPTTSTINGAASLVIEFQWDSITIVSDGTNYNAI